MCFDVLRWVGERSVDILVLRVKGPGVLRGLRTFLCTLLLEKAGTHVKAGIEDEKSALDGARQQCAAPEVGRNRFRAESMG